MLTVGSLFAGIGGFDLGLERTGGFKTLWFCEQDEFCQRVLAKHWPDAPCYPDIRELRGADVEPVDVLCGGFPCQDISAAGKGAGLAGERSGLWSEYARLVRELRPKYVLVENVPPLRKKGLEVVLADFLACGYDVEWDGIPASAVGAHHKRDRIWLVAYPSGESLRLEPGGVRGTDGAGEALVGLDGETQRLAASPDAVCQGLEGHGGAIRTTPEVAITSNTGAGEHVADSDCERRVRGSGHLSQATGGGQPEDGGCTLADAHCQRELQQGGSERTERRRACDSGGQGDGPDPDGCGCEPRQQDLQAREPDTEGSRGRATESELGGVADGFSGGLDRPVFGDDGRWIEPPVSRTAEGVPQRGPRLKSLGNALVPQIAEWIGHRILEHEGAGDVN